MPAIKKQQISMTQSIGFTNSIIEPMGFLSGFNISDKVWNQYQRFAVPKIMESTMKLRGALYYVKDFSPKQAAEELEHIADAVSILQTLRVSVAEMDFPEFKMFKKAAMDFFNAVDELQSALEDVAEVHHSYRLTVAAFSEDWDSESDQCWDNY